VVPNWTFLILHFFHTMALALWVGGSVAIAALLAPAAFAEAPDRSTAGRIVGAALLRFDLLIAAAIPILLVTSVLMAQWYGRWSPWYAIQYTCIALMSVSALLSMTVIAPRLRRLRESAGGRPPGEDFRRWHRLASLAMQFNLACGTMAILFS
jgi:uncharacterized membrane protein